MDKNAVLAEQFHILDDRLEDLEALMNANQLPELAEVLPEGVAIIKGLLTAYGEHADKHMPDSDDLLEVLKAFVKGDPSLNAVRDNVRELVYYQNCLAEDRHDALPAKPENMMVRTVRHIYLYLRSRCDQEGRLDV